MSTFRVVSENKWSITCVCQCGQWEERSKEDLELPCSSLEHREFVRIKTIIPYKQALNKFPDLEIPKSYWSGIVNRSKGKKGKPVNISLEDLWMLFLQQNRKCALTGVELWFAGYDHFDTTASLDRIDSGIGYEKDNIQWVHKTINRMKSNLSEVEFYDWCRRVAERLH